MTRRFIVFSLAMVSFLIVGAAALLAQRPPRAPISWSQPEVRAYVAKGHSQTATVSFRSTDSLKNVTLDVVPALRPFVTLRPTQLGSLPANQEQTVTISIVIPASAGIGAHDGTIHVRSGSTTIARPLAVSLTIDPFPLPPDPGDAGKQTLQGIDSDLDGVRDDVQRWIGIRHQDSPTARQALSQYARGLQLSMTTAPDSAAAAIAQISGIRCLGSVIGTQPGWTAVSAELRSRMLNTAPRIDAYAVVRQNAPYGLIPPARESELGRYCLP